MSERGRDHGDTGGVERHECIVIGGGQTGLATGYELRRAGIDFVILDAGERVGDAWRHRWDSLRLFTQARWNGLPGMDFPGSGVEFIGKNQMADFLESYAGKMNLPVRTGTLVTRVTRDGDEFVVETGESTLRAPNVVVAMADYQKPKVPEFAADLDPAITQLHSTDYRNPSQLPEGKVLVVGLGNSGADIGLDIAATHETIVAGKESGAVPFALEGWFGRNIGTRLVRFVMVRVLNTSTPIGRRVRPKALTKSAPLVRVRPKELARAGVRRVGRIEGVESGKPVTAGGETLDVSAVVWCTGFRHGFDWIDLPVFDEGGTPIHERGIVASEPGLYFVGLYFLHALWSETVTGMQPDVRHVVNHLASRRAGRRAS